MDAFEFNVELAGLADLAGVMVCVIAAYARYPERIGRSRAAVGAICNGWINSHYVYVLRGPRGGVRGVIVMRPEAGTMLIDNVAVHPRYQRRGYGKRLMKFAENQARAAGLHDLLLFTNELMTNNVGYYQSLGYVEIDRRLHEGYKRVFMRKSLD